MFENIFIGLCWRLLLYAVILLMVRAFVRKPYKWIADAITVILVYLMIPVVVIVFAGLFIILTRGYL